MTTFLDAKPWRSTKSKSWGLMVALLLGFWALPHASAADMCRTEALRGALPERFESTSRWRVLLKDESYCVWSQSQQTDQVYVVAAVATFDAAPSDLARFVSECSEIKRVFRQVLACRDEPGDDGDIRMFQQLWAPWPAKDRHFTARLTRSAGANGVHDVTWELDETSLAPSELNSVPLRRNTGHWRFKPDDATGKTLGFYYLDIDPGGAIQLPKWIIDYGYRQALPNMFQDLRDAVP